MIEYESLDDTQLQDIYNTVGQILSTRKQAAKETAINEIKKQMIAAGLSPRDFVTPSIRTANPNRSSDRNPQFGKDKMLPALQVILKDGPVGQAELRSRLHDEFGLPFNTIGMLVRYGYVERTDDGGYKLTTNT